MLISVTSAIALKYKNFHENILSYSNKAQMYTETHKILKNILYIIITLINKMYFAYFVSSANTFS